MDVRGRKFRAAHFAAARSAVCGHSVSGFGRTVLSGAHEAQHMGVGAVDLSDSCHTYLYGFHPGCNDADLYAEQFYRQYVVGNSGDPRLFRCRQGGRAAGACQNA